MTQGKLAKIINAEQSTISGWETDPARQPSRVMIPKLAHALKVTASHLEFGGATDRAELPHSSGAAAGDPVPAAGIDPALLTECIRMSMKSLLASYGLDIPEKRFDQAALTAASAYSQYYQLREGDAA